MYVKLWKLTQNVSTVDDVTGEPIGSEFTGTPIRQVIGVFASREAANIAAEQKAKNLPVWVSSLSVSEVQA